MKRIILISIFIISYIISSAQTQIPNTISKTDKIYGLSVCWKELNQNFVYLADRERVEIESLYKRLISDVQKTENDYEYYRLLQKFYAFLGDGHTSVSFPRNVSLLLSNNNFEDCRLFFRNIDEKVIINKVSSNKKDEIPIGTEVLTVNGIPVQEHLNQYVYPYICTSTEHDKINRATSLLLYGLIGTTYDLDCRLPNGQRKTIQVTLAPYKEMELYPPAENKEMVDFKWLDNKIAYVSINTFMDNNGKSVIKEFEKFLPELYKAKKMIIDIRDNSGGNSGNSHAIVEYLTSDSVVHLSRWYTREHNSAYKSWSPNVQVTIGIEDNEWAKKAYLMGQDNYYYASDYSPAPITADKKRIIIPTAVLIGNNTFSAAEDFLIYVDNLSHVIKIGEPTGGSTGNPWFFNLPGGGNARVCTKKDTYPDGRIFVGVGVLPDITVKYTLEDYMKNNDPVLNEALRYLNSVKNVSDVAKHPRASKPYEGTKIPVYWAGTSSFQQYQGIENTYDGSTRTFYHSSWNNSADDYFPITLDYSFMKQDRIDYIVYYPRQDNSISGHFKEVEIWASTEDNPEFVKLADYDFKGMTTPTKVKFNSPVTKPKTIRFVVKSGTGVRKGFATCSEMEFYKLPE